MTVPGVFPINIQALQIMQIHANGLMKSWPPHNAPSQQFFFGRLMTSKLLAKYYQTIALFLSIVQIVESILNFKEMIIILSKTSKKSFPMLLK